MVECPCPHLHEEEFETWMEEHEEAHDSCKDDLLQAMAKMKEKAESARKTIREAGFNAPIPIKDNAIAAEMGLEGLLGFVVDCNLKNVIVAGSGFFRSIQGNLGATGNKKGTPVPGPALFANCKRKAESLRDEVIASLDADDSLRKKPLNEDKVKLLLHSVSHQNCSECFRSSPKESKRATRCSLRDSSLDVPSLQGGEG